MEFIIRAESGKHEREVALVDCHIPDLWHLYAYMDGNCPPNVDVEWWERQRRLVMDCWTLAHDLKRHIAKLSGEEGRYGPWMGPSKSVEGDGF